MGWGKGRVGVGLRFSESEPEQAGKIYEPILPGISYELIQGEIASGAA